MSEKQISPLRQRMIDDMTARRFSEKVQKAYVRHVKTFAAFLGRSPDTATSDTDGGKLIHAGRVGTGNRSRNIRGPPIARSSSLFGTRLPGYCLPFLFDKLLTVHRFLEASDTVVGESASRGRVGPHQCSEPERSVARRFLIPAKGCEAAKPLLARTSDVAIGLLRDRGACKRERGDGG
jgi:hypothetical protein